MDLSLVFVNELYIFVLFVIVGLVQGAYVGGNFAAYGSPAQILKVKSLFRANDPIKLQH